MALSVTKICNLSLSDIGSKRINNFETNDSEQAIMCRLHYEPTRDALLRSHRWRFARARATLSKDVTDPDTDEWDNQFILPNDFLRFRSIEEEKGYSSRSRRHSIEGDRFLTNFSTVNMRYIRKVTDVTKFDPLFVQVLVLQLDLKLITGLAKTDTQLKESIKNDLKELMPKVQAVDDDETNVGGRSDWNLARHGGLGIAGQEERFW
jgi:hypothetical protein